ncbi:MAG: glutamate racemase [Nannocystaceae bacterium]|nr:glutamate racemase [Nannocystaceae bacterium]
MTTDLHSLPIGVFDSGVGGLTVLRALRGALPRESFLYLGDTARLPYGTKSAKTVERYAKQAAQVLVDRGVKLLVIACNTVSAVAVGTLREQFGPLRVVGVVEPGAEAACAATSSGHILVTGTEGTIRGAAYERAIRRRRPEATVLGQPCPLFVALAEEAWTQGDVPELAARRYLEPHFTTDPALDTVVLGCTHFPVLSSVVQRVVGPGVTVVDSATTTAGAVSSLLTQLGLVSQRVAPGALTLLATDDAERFARVGSSFLCTPLHAEDVELVDL